MEINKSTTNHNQSEQLHPLLREIINRLVTSGAGEVYMTDDGHLFLQSSVSIKALWGAMDMKKEGQKYGVRIVARKVRKRAKNSKYTGMPWLQLYVLPIVKKNAKTMTDAERRNMEMNTQALKMAHAVERDPEQAAAYHELHEAHKRNPAGYTKLYPTFFGFLVATFRMQLEAEETAKAAEQNTPAEESEMHREKAVRVAKPCTGIRLCAPSAAHVIALRKTNGRYLPRAA